MALISRFSRLLKADVHAVLDRIEEPETLLRQAVREMQSEYDRSRQRVSLLEQEQQSMQRQATEIAQLLQRIESQLDDCFDADRDDLVRGLIRQRLEQQHMRDLLNKRIETQASLLASAKARQQTQHNALHGMLQKLEILTRDDTTAANAGGNVCRQHVVSEDDVELELVREQKRRSQR